MVSMLQRATLTNRELVYTVLAGFCTNVIALVLLSQAGLPYLAAVAVGRLAEAAPYVLLLASAYGWAKVPWAGIVQRQPLARFGRWPLVWLLVAVLAGSWVLRYGIDTILAMRFVLSGAWPSASDMEAMAAANANPWNVVGLVGCAAIAEEWTMRGVLLNLLLMRTSGHRAVLICTVVFALPHESPLHAGLAGLALGYLYLLSGKLWLTMLAHAAVNLASTVWSRWQLIPLMPDSPSDFPGSMLVSLLCIAALLAFFVLGALRTRGARLPTPFPQPTALH